MEKAFKQLARKTAHACFAIFGIWNPMRGKAELYEALVMPFGVKASVHGFNRAARALSVILNQLFAVLSTHYFDDYPLVVPECMESGTEETAFQVLDLLGWRYKREGAKALPFAETFATLGVDFALGEAPRG